MKCKECGAKIPDNKKFCIDCGAWVNPPEERQCIHNNYYEPERYRYNSPVLKNYEQQNSNPASYNKTADKNLKINKSVVVLAVIIFVVFAVLIASMVLFDTIDEFFSDDTMYDDTSYIDSIINDYMDDYNSSVDLNDGYADEQEQFVLEYVDNYIKGMSYDTFDKFTALDTEKVYTDIMNNRMEYHNFTTEEQFFNDLQGIYEEPVSDVHSHISADLKSFTDDNLTYFNDMYGTQDFSFAVTYSCEINSEELYDYYYSYTDEILSAADKKTSDYLPDYNVMTDIYDIGVDFFINDGYTTNYQAVWIVVADTGNGLEIVYDDLLINKMFSSINY